MDFAGTGRKQSGSREEGEPKQSVAGKLCL